MDINSLLSSVLSGISGDAVRYTDAASSIGQAATATEDASNAAISQAATDIPKAQANAQGAADINYQQAQLVQRLQRDAMLDPAAANNAYTQGLAELTDLNSQRTQTAAEVTKLSSTNLLEDPFGFVMAQLQLPVVTAKLEGLTNQAAVVTHDVQTRLNLSKAAQSTVVADTADKAKALAYQQAELAANAARTKLDMASAEVKSKVGADMLRQADALSKITAANKDLYNMAIQAEHWDASMEDRKEARAAFAAERAARFADKKDKEVLNAARQANLAASYALLGLPNAPDLATFDKSQNTPQKKAISDLTLNGNLGATLRSSLTTFLAADPSFAGIEAGGNAGFSKLVQGLNRTGMAAVQTIARKPDAAGKFPSHTQALEQGLDMYETNMVSGAGDMKTRVPLTSTYWDSNFSPYKADHKRLAAQPDLLNNNVVMSVVRTLAPTVPSDLPQFRGSDEQQVLRTVAAMVGSNKININDAATQIADYYKTSAIINQDWYKYDLMALPKQTSYMAQVTIPGFFADTIVPNPKLSADLMNPTDAKRLLLGIITATATPKTTDLGNTSLGGFR